MKANITSTIHIGSKEQADRYCKRARQILQTDYSEKKKLAAKRHYFKAMEVDDDEEIMDEDKQAIQNEIFEKMQQMNDMFIDLDEEEIDQIQDILDFEYAESSDDDGSSDDDEVSESGFEWLVCSNNNFPVPITSKLEIVDSEQLNDSVNDEQSSNDDAEYSALNLAEITGAETCVTDENSVQSTSDESNVFDISNGALNSNVHTDEQTYVDDDDSLQNTVDEVTTGTSNVVVLKNEEENANAQDDSDTDPFFSPPSSSNVMSKIPDHFARLDPNLHNLLCKQANDNSQSMAMARKSQMGLQDMLETVKLIFPGQCTYVSWYKFIS